MSLPRSPRSRSTVLVAGSGPAGLAAALALAARDIDTVLVGPRGAQAADTRTAALFTNSIRLLERLGCWPALAGRCAPIRAIRLVDDMGRLLRAPEVLFRAEEVGLEMFGANVPNALLTAVLADCVAGRSRIVWLADRTIARLEPGREEVVAALDDGSTVSAKVAVAADGRHSPCRAGTGIATTSWSYPQTAVATQFRHSRPHGDISTELHRPAGPLTVVPMPDNGSSLVWVETPDVAKSLMALDERGFRGALEERLNGLLGAIREIGPRRPFPLVGISAASLAARRVLLAGEAAHVFPPIGAQGLNLGLRDVAAAADLIGEAVARGEDPGGEPLLRRYRAARSSDVGARTAAVDMLNRSLLADALPVQLLRGAGLHVAHAISPVRRWLMRLGLEPV